MERAKRCRDILGLMPVDLADETQGQMQLIVALPTRARDAVHRREKNLSNGARRAQRDEQAMRGHDLACIVGAAPRRDPRRNKIALKRTLSGFA